MKTSAPLKIDTARAVADILLACWATGETPLVTDFTEYEELPHCTFGPNEPERVEPDTEPHPEQYYRDILTELGPDLVAYMQNDGLRKAIAFHLTIVGLAA